MALIKRYLCFSCLSGDRFKREFLLTCGRNCLQQKLFDANHHVSFSRLAFFFHLHFLHFHLHITFFSFFAELKNTKINNKFHCVVNILEKIYNSNVMTSSGVLENTTAITICIIYLVSKKTGTLFNFQNWVGETSPHYPTPLVAHLGLRLDL